MRKQNEEITIKGLVDIFLPKLWLVLLVGIVFAVAVGGYSKFLKKDTYTSYVSFIVVADTTSIPTSGGYDGVQSLVTDYIHLLSSRSFCEMVANDMLDDYGPATAAEVKRSMSVKQHESANFIYAYVKSESPEFAKSAADAIDRLAYGYVSERCDYKVKISSVDHPLLPEIADDKNVGRNAIVAFAAGAILTMLIIFVVSRFDVRIRSKEMIEEAFEDIPILGVIPRLEYDAAKGAESDSAYSSSTAKAPQRPDVVDGRVVFKNSDR